MSVELDEGPFVTGILDKIYRASMFKGLEFRVCMRLHVSFGGGIFLIPPPILTSKITRTKPSQLELSLNLRNRRGRS